MQTRLVLATVLLSGALAVTAAMGTDEGRPHVVFVTGDDEYRSEYSMAMIADVLQTRHQMRTTVLFAEPTPQTKDNIVGLEALKDADLAVFYLRFRALPEEQLRAIVEYADSGKPLVGLRTTTHAFLYPAEHKHARLNDAFGRDVFGQKWLFHYGHESSTDVKVCAQHPITRGLEPEFHVRSWLYHVIPLAGDCTPLLEGTAVETKNKNPVTNPVAWTKTHKGARVFFTTLGHPDDFHEESARRLVVNGILWAVGKEVPARGADVTIPGKYDPPKDGVFDPKRRYVSGGSKE